MTDLTLFLVLLLGGLLVVAVTVLLVVSVVAVRFWLGERRRRPRLELMRPVSELERARSRDGSAA